MQERNSVELGGFPSSSTAPARVGVKRISRSSVKRTLRHVFCMKTANVLAISVVICLVILRLFCFIVFAIFDMTCFAYERTPNTNCTRNMFVSKPLSFVYSWLAISILTSTAMLVGVNLNLPGVTFYGFKPSFKKLLKNQSFWSFNFIMLIVLSHYAVRTNFEASKKAFPLILIGLKVLNLTMVYTLNYVHPIGFPERLFHAKHTVPFLVYWSYLVLHFLENLYLFISNSLDIMENIYPLGTSDTDRLVFVMLYLVLGANVTFHLRCVAFFWTKFFNGDRDLFSDISTLDDIPTND